MSSEAWEELLREEWEYARSLRRKGKIVGIWRLAGTLANVAIYSVATHEELHGILRSLPLARYQEVTVRPVTAHPVMAETET